MHQGLQDLKNLLLQGWEQSREIHLHLNSFLKTSSGVDCWASGLFTILEKMENGMQPTSTLTGILYGKLENDIWKIDELRFVPLFFPSLSI